MILAASMIALTLPIGQQASADRQRLAPVTARESRMNAMTRSADAAAVAAIPRAIAAAPEKGTVFPRQIYMPDLSDLYPPSALREEQQGRVHLKCTLAVAGTLKNCAVALSSGVAALDGAAFEVAKLARYSPKIVDRVPEESQVILPVVWMIME